MCEVWSGQKVAGTKWRERVELRGERKRKSKAPITIHSGERGSRVKIFFPG